MRKIGNRGLSLVELIVAFAIFSIVGVAVCGFITFCTKNFSISNTNVKLQYEQQIVVNRVRDAILETSRGISFNEGTGKLIVFSDNAEYDPDVAGSSPYYVSEFRFESAGEGEKGKLYYGYSNNIPKDTPMADILGMAFSENQISDSLSEFKVDLSKLKDNEVLLTMTFKVGDKELTVNPVISLRNIISEVDEDVDMDDLYDGEVVEVYSAVAKVEIERDGKVFGQSRTDTIEMADGGSTTVDYNAIVTKKKTYKGDIDTTVSWSLDLGTLKEGYQNCITLAGDGLITLTDYYDGAGKHTPNDYMKSDTFILVATSNEDPTKSARLKIKVKTGGVYPESLSTYHTTENDLENGKLIITLLHSISYSGLVEDPITGAMVNPITGSGAYKKIKYVSCVDETGAEPPAGGGFTSLGTIDGIFVVNKSMENHTYTVTIQVLQKNKMGQVLEEKYQITIPEGAVPDKVEVSRPTLMVQETSLRGDYTTMSAAWSNGVPAYKENDNADATTAYNYWYEWTVTDNENKDKKWNTTQIKLEDGTTIDTTMERTSFKDLVFFSSGVNYADFNQGQTVTTPKTKRTHMIYVRPYLEWSVAYTYSVELRVKISKSDKEADALYFKLPQRDTDVFSEMTTDNPDEAYVCTQVVTIDPVSYTLTPAQGAMFYQDGVKDKGPINSIFSTSTTVGKGKRPENQWYQDPVEKDYYKLFTPAFKGLSVTIFNFRDNLYNKPDVYGDNPDNGAGIQTVLSKDKKGNVTASALQPYTTEENGVYYIKDNTEGFSSGIRMLDKIDNKLYFYLRLRPDDWIKTGKLVSGCRWTCLIKDSKGNEATAQFKFPTDEKADPKDAVYETTDYANYKIVNAYEGEY